MTIKDVAEKAGVSVATVSRVINNASGVKAATVARVNAAIEALSYTRKRSRSQGLKNRTVALIVPDIVNTFFSTLTKGIERTARIHGYQVVVYDSENSHRVEAEVLARLQELGAGGLIYVTTGAGNPEIERLVKSGYPLVFLDRTLELPSIASVTSDNEEGGYQAARYLIELGHRRILYLAGQPELSTEKQRYRGFLRALKESGLKPAAELYARGDFLFGKACDEVAKRLRRGDDFTAIFASDDLMAFGAKQAVEAHGLGIPEDISLMGFDDIFFSSAVGLTTVSQPTYEMGKNAMLLLIDLMKGRIAPPHEVVLRPSIVIRSSCRRIPRSG